MFQKSIAATALIASASATEKLIFEDNFDSLNFTNW